MSASARNEPSGATAQPLSMPMDNPAFPVSPITFGARHGLTVITQADPELLQQLLRLPLSSVGNKLIIQFNFNTITSPIQVDYPNVTVIVPAVFGEQAGLYFARVYEGSAQATMLSLWGREIWGFPKVAADVEVIRHSSSGTARMVCANGIAKANVLVEFTDTPAFEKPQSDLSVFCRKMIPRSDGQGYDIDRLVLAPILNTRERHVAVRIIQCDFQIDLGGKQRTVPVDQEATAFWYDQDPGLVLNLGQDVHDYLAK
ncbi:MAG: acetoacetate decarboxylase family protein [Pirellulaceae bacterium]